MGAKAVWKYKLQHPFFVIYKKNQRWKKLEKKDQSLPCRWTRWTRTQRILGVCCRIIITRLLSPVLLGTVSRPNNLPQEHKGETRIKETKKLEKALSWQGEVGLIKTARSAKVCLHPHPPPPLPHLVISKVLHMDCVKSHGLRLHFTTDIVVIDQCSVYFTVRECIDILNTFAVNVWSHSFNSQPPHQLLLAAICAKIRAKIDFVAPPKFKIIRNKPTTPWKNLEIALLKRNCHRPESTKVQINLHTLTLYNKTIKTTRAVYFLVCIQMWWICHFYLR